MKNCWQFSGRSGGRRRFGAGWKYTAIGGVRYPCVRNVLFRGGERGYVIRLQVVGHERGNGEGSRENPCKLPK